MTQIQSHSLLGLSSLLDTILKEFGQNITKDHVLRTQLQAFISSQLSTTIQFLFESRNENKIVGDVLGEHETHILDSYLAVLNDIANNNSTEIRSIAQELWNHLIQTVIHYKEHDMALVFQILDLILKQVEYFLSG